MASDVRVPDAYWIRGINSILEPTLLKEGEYQWGVNIENSGGIIQTRPGFRWQTIPGSSESTTTWEPRGMTFFKDINGVNYMVVVRGSEIWASSYPFLTMFKIGDGLGTTGPVTFQRVIRSAARNVVSGALTILPVPVPYLVMQGGGQSVKYWDGSFIFTADSNNLGIPIGDWMQWSNGRLWVASDRQLHGSDLGDPFSFWEESNVAGGGSIYFADTITGLFQTPDLRNLLIATDFQTSALQSGVTDRTLWTATNDFVKVLLPGIGCAAGKSFCHQYGMTWWYAHGGLVRLDSALNTYRTSIVKFQDQLMMRGKANMNSDISGIVTKAFGNFLLLAVPSGGNNNPEVWVMNQATLQTGDSSDAESWISTWKGLHIIDMAITVTHGEQRLFALSRDKNVTGDPIPADQPATNVWELFTGQREDVTFDHFRRIPCLWQSRFFGMGEELKKFDFAEIELSEGRGVVDMQVYVATRRGGFYKIMDKRLAFSQGSINSCMTSTVKTTVTDDAPSSAIPLKVVDTTGFLTGPSSVEVNGRKVKYLSKTSTQFTTDSAVFVPVPAGSQVTQPQFRWGPNPEDEKTIFKTWMPQRRILRTSGWNLGENSTPIESNKPDNIDRAFSVMIKWSGKVAITGVWLFASTISDYTMGKCEEDEELARNIDDAGIGMISPDIIQPITSQLYRNKSQYLRNISHLPVEDEYEAFVLPDYPEIP